MRSACTSSDKMLSMFSSTYQHHGREAPENIWSLRSSASGPKIKLRCHPASCPHRKHCAPVSLWQTSSPGLPRSFSRQAFPRRCSRPRAHPEHNRQSPYCTGSYIAEKGTGNKQINEKKCRVPPLSASSKTKQGNTIQKVWAT